MDPIIGIDLGTTHSAVAVIGEGGVKLIPNALGDNLTPSVIALDEEDRLLVGSTAKEYQVLHSERCASLFKRHMGTNHLTKIGKRTFTPEELSSLVLASLKRDAEQYLGGPVSKAVITVPAYFNDRQRKATIAAGQIAGLQVQRILNEPTAAAIAYGLHEGKEDKTILIFDLGGGTFDVSIVEFFDGALEVRASSGENFLGGEDFTRSIVSLILEKEGIAFERAEMETPKRVSRLLQLCESAKRKLSFQESAVIPVPNKAGVVVEGGATFELPRSMLEDRLKTLLARTELPVRRVLNDSKLSKEKLDEVILVGGATRMPIVRKRVKDMLGREPMARLNPDEVVAMGAAVQAGLFNRSEAVEDLVVTDVSPYTLGIEVVKELGNQIVEGYFSALIERNTTIPVSRVENFSTVAPNQPQIEIRVFQGDGRKTENNLLLGAFTVKGIPPGPRGQVVAVRFTYDLNGVLEVEATVEKTGKKTSHVITSGAKQMTPEQVKKALAAMSALKIHPRENETNRYSLLRAERLYAELPKDLRERLSELMDVFEAALNRQDPSLIDEARGQLDMFLSTFDGSEPEDGDG